MRSSAEKQPIRPLEGTNELSGRGLTSFRSTCAGHQTWPGVYRARVAQGRVGSRVNRPSTKIKLFGRYASEFRSGFTPVKASTRTQGWAHWASEGRSVGFEALRRKST